MKSQVESEFLEVSMEHLQLLTLQVLLLEMILENSDFSQQVSILREILQSINSYTLRQTRQLV